MDYLIDNIPGITMLSEEWRTFVKQKAMGIFMWADWMCGTRDPREFIADHPTYFVGELMFLFLGLLVFIHACRAGGRFVYLWIGIIIHAVNVELISYWVPDIDNFWHAQSTMMLFGRRLPVYILFGLYPFIIYVATIAARRLQLPWWAEGPAVGLGAVLLDIPYDIMGVKMLWWSWHDTDPNVYDRMYWVPWTSYYFHAAFACSFTWMLKLARLVLVEKEYDWKKFVMELLCVMFAGTTAFWVGAAQFVPIYHVFHDLCGVHSECCTLVFLGIYALLVWVADRNPDYDGCRPDTDGARYWFDEVSLAILIHYVFFMVLAVVGEPESVVSVGLHEPIGPCEEYVPVYTISGLMLRKRKYLCPMRYDEKYYDFHCLPGRKPPKMSGGNPVEWYPICGTPFPNHPEYIFVVWSFALFGIVVFYHWMARSGETPLDPVVEHKRKHE